MKESTVDALKIEVTESTECYVEALIELNIPHIAHLGFTPQSVEALGGYKVQGRDKETAEKIIKAAKACDARGCFAIVVEMIPSELGKQLSEAVSVPVIGIGAGADCDGQVLVVNDVLGMGEFFPKFSRQYEQFNERIMTAIKSYKQDVETGVFPNKAESFS